MNPENVYHHSYGKPNLSFTYANETSGDIIIIILITNRWMKKRPTSTADLLKISTTLLGIKIRRLNLNQSLGVVRNCALSRIDFDLKRCTTGTHQPGQHGRNLGEIHRGTLQIGWPRFFLFQGCRQVLLNIQCLF